MRQVTISTEAAAEILAGTSNQCGNPTCGAIVIPETFGGAAHMNHTLRVFHSRSECLMSMMAIVSFDRQREGQSIEN